MQYDQFIGEVQNRARLASQGEAVRAVEATLQTLAERLTGGEVKDLAAQLPQEIAFFLRGEGAARGERLSLQSFLERISLRENVDLPKSIHHARAVLEVLQEAVSPGEIEDVLAQLPQEYRKLFESGSEGEM